MNINIISNVIIIISSIVLLYCIKYIIYRVNDVHRIYDTLFEEEWNWLLNNNKNLGINNQTSFLRYKSLPDPTKLILNFKIDLKKFVMSVKEVHFYYMGDK